MTGAVPDALGPPDVSRETEARLRVYEQLLRKWSPRINLVSARSLADLWPRHILDSLQVWEAAPAGARNWLDLGSGGGFPGVVVALAAANDAPGLAVTLVESDQRKATFLRTVSRETGVPFAVAAERIETLPPAAADVVSARALAPLETLLAHAARHLAPDGTALFPKGARHQAELAVARAAWDFEHETLPSRTESGAVLYRIRKVRRV